MTGLIGCVRKDRLRMGSGVEARACCKKWRWQGGRFGRREGSSGLDTWTPRCQPSGCICAPEQGLVVGMGYPGGGGESAPGRAWQLWAGTTGTMD